MKKILISLTIILLNYQAIRADTIYYKNGTVKTGKIIGHSRKIIRLKINNGEAIVIPKTKIRRIKYTRVLSKKEKAKKRKVTILKRKRRQKAKLAEEKRVVEEARLKKEREDALAKLEASKLAEQDRIKQAQLDKNKIAEQNRKNNEARLAELERKKQAQKRKQSRSTKSTIGALWRSALIPGWGQWQRGQKLKGGLFAGGALLGIVGLYETNRVMQNTVRDSNSLLNPDFNTSILLEVLNTTLVPNDVELQDPITLTIYNQTFVNQTNKFKLDVQKFRYAGYTMLAIYGWNLFDAWLFPPNKVRKQVGSNSVKNSSQTNQVWYIVPVIKSENFSSFSFTKNKTLNKQFRHELYFSRSIDF